MTRQGAHDWGDRPPPTGPRARVTSSRKRRADDRDHNASDRWTRPESQSYRPAPRSPSPKRHKLEPYSNYEASPPRYGEPSYHVPSGISIRGSAPPSRRYPSESEDEEVQGPPAQLGDYQVCRQASEDMGNGAGGVEGASDDFSENLGIPNFLPEAAARVTQEIKNQLDTLAEFLALPQLKNAEGTWSPIYDALCGQVIRIERFCNYANKERRALHGDKIDFRRKYDKDCKTQIAEMEGYKRTADRQKQEIESYKRHITKLDKDVEGYKKEVGRLETDGKRQAVVVEGQKEKISKLEQNLSKQIEETETYKKKAAKLEEDYTKHAADREGRTNQVIKLAEENSKLTAAIEGYKSQISELEKKGDHDKPSAGVEDSQQKASEAQGRRISVVGLTNHGPKPPKGQKDGPMEPRAKTPMTPKDSSRDVQAYKAQIKELEETREQQNVQIQQCQGEIERWTQQFWNQGVEKEGYKLDIGRLQQDIGRLQQDIIHLQQDKGRLEQDLSKAASQRSKHVTELRRLQEKLRVIKTTDPRAELLRALDEKQKVEVAVAEDEKRYRSLQVDHEAQVTKVQNLERDLAEQKKKFTAIRVENQRSLNTIKLEKQELERQLREAQKTVHGTDSLQSSADLHRAAPDIDQLMAGIEPMMPPVDVPGQPGEHLPKSEPRADVGELASGTVPTKASMKSSAPPEGPRATMSSSGTDRSFTATLGQEGERQAQGDTENYRQQIRLLQGMVREKDERIKQVAAEKTKLQSLFDEKVTQIEKNLQVGKNRLQQQAQGFDDKSGNAAINAILKTRVDKLLIKDKEKDTELRQLKEANSKLEYLVGEKGDKYKQLLAVNVSLQGMVQEKTAAAERLEGERNQLEMDIKAKVDHIQLLQVKINEIENRLQEETEKTTKLRQIMAHKEVEISTLRAASSLPDTPVSTVSNASFHNQIPQATSDEGAGANNDSDPTRQRESTVFIKRERLDTARDSLESGPHDLAQETRQGQDLRKGIVSLLATLYDTDPGQNVETVAKYISCLGIAQKGLTAPDTIADVAPIKDAWRLKDVWSQDSSTPHRHVQHTGTMARFAHMCLLLSSIQDGQRNDMSTCQLVGELAHDLVSANDFQLPLAGKAFLDCMTSSQPTAKPERVKVRQGLMAIMICELCRHLQRVFPEAPKCHWGIAEVLGKTEDEAPETSPIWKLATILAEEDTRSDPLEMRKRLTQTCGDKFSFFYQTDENNKDREVGLLSCGDGTEDDGVNGQIFLMLDFEQRSIRLVECSLAYFTSNRAAPRMLDLVIAREEAAGQEVELFKIEAAPKDVAAFWLKHICYGG
ncbi:putative myosin-2 heavy chain [Triangularia verruculosa]|uniref:Myosin-2 heavy chain n=1 Tax=Triangularia verruculosa TaxID=2587418 RepID=A0AAN7AZS7_9PEZI|nr:putative myosin-2 heavy chain [Triangularia verruculosa]